MPANGERSSSALDPAVLDRLEGLLPHAGRELFVGIEERETGLGRDREARRNRYAEARHVGEAVVGSKGTSNPSHRIDGATPFKYEEGFSPI